MCGIVGFYQSKLRADQLQSTIDRMTKTLIHRGPDDQGLWIKEDRGLAFGHRRLAIIDLSPLGHQPMKSASGRFEIVLNGEIYNYKILRKDLEALGHHFRGNSDTEVLLAAFEAWGLEAALKKCVGMFALALWDEQHKTLSLARDRLGEKPLYYGWANETFLFGSELKALQAYPDFKKEVDRDVVALFMRYCYVPAPYSIYKNIFKLVPGTYLTVSNASDRPKPVEYWSARDVALNQSPLKFSSDHEATDELEALLKNAVSLQMVADVPIGAFLSGGIDSSTIVALMQSLASRPVKTFSIGFDDKNFNEAPYAKAIAAHLKTDHTEFYATPKEAMEVIPSLGKIYDEPFGDSSQIPTLLLSRLTRQFVTVSLSGDGGDELFGGYNRYFMTGDLWKRIEKMPRPIRSFGASLLQAVPYSAWGVLQPIIKSIVPKKFKVSQLGNKIPKLAKVLKSTTLQKVYDEFISHWTGDDDLVLGAKDVQTHHDGKTFGTTPDPIQRMMLTDIITYLPDDILAKVDRATMRYSLESRTPFLDHRVVEFALRLPTKYKIRDGQGKWLLRQVLKRYVPDELIDRPKMGFGIPLKNWVSGPLLHWSDPLLATQKIRADGYLNPDRVAEFWSDFKSGRDHREFHLWNILMFQEFSGDGLSQGALPDAQISSR